jgi:hypothetical protein
LWSSKKDSGVWFVEKRGYNACEHDSKLLKSRVNAYPSGKDLGRIYGPHRWLGVYNELVVKG